MNRRTVLAFAGFGLTSTVAGCVDDAFDQTAGTDPGDSVEDEDRETDDGGNEDRETDDGGDEWTDIDPDFEQCNASIIPYSRLPDEAKREVDRALETGVYESGGDLWFTHAVGPNSVVEKDGTYYDWDVEVVETGSRLRLEETTPTWPGTHDLEVVNDTDETVVVSVTVSDDEGDVVFEREDIEARPDDEIDSTDRPSLPITNEYGPFEIHTTVDGDRREPGTWDIRRDTGGTADLVVTIEGTEIRTHHVALHTCVEEYHTE
ncbi:hypothetical protein [Natrarchaeobius chitinivorans]|uniref:DUF7979 domain-containing protein n=1 Tax=Natrarchaeobius chitinivorans TaxID=1679083 RepID=A0A3N6PFP5_NATCH|nr:hypothetical protein [Natrarchaeobius chitinivorans]RQG96435.1 hypothetical protein EA473_04750 [Natrarchaeobius chitinivorans]